ncbi:hypothetical protein AX16_010440 [Volvariella volvacea WC 439]|nr:hypothetical protein AX16_010440 [Volvariella volvacea WC 439]
MRLTTTFVLSLLPLSLATFPIPPIYSSLLVSDISQKGLSANLWELDKIARANGGNRAFGLSGYKASVDFIVSNLRKYRLLIDYRLEEFDALFQRVEEIDFREAGAEEGFYVYGLTYSPSTPPEGITAPLVLGPEGAAGCSVTGYEGLDVKDKIVLIDRFRCPDQTTFAGRVRPAVAAGAAGVIIYNFDATKPTAGTLSAPDPVGYRPTGWIYQSDGLALKARLEAGEDITVFWKQIQVIETRQTWNVIAETKFGDPNTVIAVGAHLDSVQAAPGINDDGSGTSLILELLRAVVKYPISRNKIRFHWWGAEENGLLGSRFHVANLPDAQAKKVLAYINFDMVSRGFFGVFDGDGSTFGDVGPAGSDVIEDLFVKYLESKESVTTTPVGFTGGTDYVAWKDRGIPVGGLFTGTGVEQDPCYHQACDGYDNHNATVLTKNARAAAHILGRLAIDGTKLIPRWKPAAAASGARVAASVAEEVHEDGHVGCGHDEI